MVVYARSLLSGFLAFLAMQVQLPLIMADCPLDLSSSNFTLTASICSNKDDRGKCCRYINAFIAVSISRLANATGNLGVPLNLSDICLQSISQTMELYGVPHNATVFCGFGTKIPVNYDCKGQNTVAQMQQLPKFIDVIKTCKPPLSAETNCRKCLNVGIAYLHHLVGNDDNVTLSTCRDAIFSALASQVDDVSAATFASCFFQVEGLNIPAEPSPPAFTPQSSPSPPFAAGPSQLMLGFSNRENHHSYHLTLVPGVGIAIAGIASMMLIVLMVLIRRKNRELEETENIDKTYSKAFPHPPSIRKIQGPTSMFQKFSYKETKKATNNFNTIIGQGGFGIVYKARFNDGSVAAVKQMNKVLEQVEEEFCREIELLARLHHRHLVALRGFCIEKHEKFLMYEYMANGSLKDHLHSSGKTPLSWQTRMQIAIDVANALFFFLHCSHRSTYIFIVILLYAIETLSPATFYWMKILLPRLRILVWHMLQKMVLFALNQ